MLGWTRSDPLIPESYKLTISVIVRLGSCGGERGMFSENRSLSSDLSLGSLVGVRLENAVPSPS